MRLQTLYNQVAYDFMVKNKYYLRANLPPVPSPRPDLPVVQFPMGSVVVKAAWLDMGGFTDAQKARFYLRMATVKDPNDGSCSKIQMGLVGSAYYGEDSEPSAVDLVFVRAGGRGAAKAFGNPGKYIFNDNDRSHAMPAENPLMLVAAGEAANAFQHYAECDGADSSEN